MKERFLQLISVAAMIICTSAVWAGPEEEDNGHHGMYRRHAGVMHDGGNLDRLVEHLSHRLELGESQLANIRNIVEAARPKADELRDRVKANREAMHALDVNDADYDSKLQGLAAENGDIATQLTLLHGRTMAQISAELTEEQRAQLKDGRDRMRRRHRHHHLRHHDDSEDDATT